MSAEQMRMQQGMRFMRPAGPMMRPPNQQIMQQQMQQQQQQQQMQQPQRKPIKKKPIKKFI